MHYVILSIDMDTTNTTELDSLRVLGVFNNKEDAKKRMMTIIERAFPEESDYTFEEFGDMVEIYQDDFIAKFWVERVEDEF